VAEETRARVERAMEKLGYLPDVVASNLASNRTRMIAAIVTSYGSALVREFLQSLADTVHPAGFLLLLGATGTSDPRAEEQLIRAFLARRPDAMVVSQINHSSDTRRLLRRSGIPVVEVGGLADDPIDMTVGFSNQEATRQLILHLVQRGYRRIATLSETIADNDRAKLRRLGYMEALHEAGLSHRADLVEAPLNIADAADAFAALMRRSPEIDAVFCSDDLLALGALAECRRRRWNVPKRVAIAGLGDLEFAVAAVPALTTVRIYRTAMGRRTGAVLLQALQGERPQQPQQPVDFEIMSRASARPRPNPTHQPAATCLPG
jgi:LacI family transcriptional regulator, gluconate utilization system Gnt-I transcriptional repressor